MKHVGLPTKQLGTRSDSMIKSINGNIFGVAGPLYGEFASQRPVTRTFDAVFDLRPNKRFSKQSRRRWFETLSPSLWGHYNDDMGTPLDEFKNNRKIINIDLALFEILRDRAIRLLCDFEPNPKYKLPLDIWFFFIRSMCHDGILWITLKWLENGTFPTDDIAVGDFNFTVYFC